MKKKLLFLLLSLCSMLHVPCSVHAQVPSYVPTNGLVGWWPFNGNGNDISGNGNNLNVNGGVQFSNDRFLNPTSSIYLTGQNQYLNKFNPNLPSGNVNRSVSVWYKNVTPTDGPTIFAQWDGVYSGSCHTEFTLLGENSNGYFHGRCEDKSWFFPIDNQWINLVLVYESNYIKMYKNGQLINNVLSPNYYNMGNNLNTATYEFRVGHPGASYTWPSQFLGYIDDIGYWNRALTQQEITNLYTNSVPPTITTAASPTLINCGESATLTASSNSTATPCAKTDLPTTLQNGLVGYWPFCGNANDVSGTGNNGTVNGATLTTDRFGNTNSAYSFDGLSNYISINNASSLNPMSISISGWVNNSSNPTNDQEGVKALITKWFQQVNCGNNGDNYTLQISRYNNTNLLAAASVYNNSLSSAIASSNDIIGLFNWHHFTFIHDGLTGEKLFVDGVLVSSNSVAGNLCSTSNKLYFGCDNALGTLWRFFHGKLDDIAIYNRALTALEIQQLYSLGNVNYSWSTGATAPSISVNPAQTTAYTCTATNSAGSTTSSVTVNVADSLSWTGLFDTDWHKPCNWSPQFVPKCCNNLAIPLTTNQPFVSGVAAAEDLTIYTTNGAQITVNTGANLQIADCPTSITTAACPSLAVLTTTAVSSITQTTAISGGTISYQGASAITARGICWNTSINPTIVNSFTTNGIGVGTFTSNLIGLIVGTTYYVRAFATNAGGTSYGNEVSFVAVNPQPVYPVNSVFCASGPTLVIDVTNPTTGKTWMDRNLGASQVATSSTDANSYGDLYQWGRGNDGHQCRNSATTSTLSSTDQPGNANFILAPNAPYDWRSLQNANLWQGINGINNPCPSGYRLPTEIELDAERTSWISNNSAGAYASLLKLTATGSRIYNTGSFANVGTFGYYWSSAFSGTLLMFLSYNAYTEINNLAYGRAVRCIKN
jgi:hypothetical protein